MDGARFRSLTFAIAVMCFAAIPIARAEIKAAVLEFGDRWTEEATGAARLLEQAGAAVEELRVDQPATALGVDLIVFGSFTNNDNVYRDYTARERESLVAFVNAGGVIVEFTQSDQFGATPAYLPDGLLAERGDRDLGVVLSRAVEHPLLSGWTAIDDGRLQFDMPGDRPLSWESFESWSGFRVLLASEPGPRLPTLLEAAHGNGRILLTSLWLDKAYRPDGAAFLAPTELSAAQQFFGRVLQYVAAVQAGTAPPVEPTPIPPEPVIGPVVGHVDDTVAWVWLRAARAGEYVLELVDDRCRVVRREKAQATAESDLTLKWRLRNLRSDTLYRYRVVDANRKVVTEADDFSFRTAPALGSPAKVVLGFGSCASSNEYPDIWQRVIDEGVQGFVLLGDTPYIDSSSRSVNRQRHRDWWRYAPIANVARNTPFWATWDDHDFGGNDTDGNVRDKDVIRDVFTKYRALNSFGDGNEGIYTHFRRGPVEVFLLDARYFAQTAPSFADPDKPTCLGATQWQWLQAKLKASTAPFKILATGMIWDDKGNSEKDDWHTYRHEREAILDFVDQEKIDGVILMGGDIHVSRALRYDDRLSYPLWQFISSPMHAGVIPSLNPPHPDLVFGEPEPNVFLKITADTTVDPPALTAEWVKMNGDRLYTVELDAETLSS